MSASLFVLGLVCIAAGLAIIIKDRLVPEFSGTTVMSNQSGRTKLLEAIASLVKAIAEFFEKLLKTFMPRERMPVFLIIIGLIMCSMGWWIGGK